MRHSEKTDVSGQTRALHPLPGDPHAALVIGIAVHNGGYYDMVDADDFLEASRRTSRATRAGGEGETRPEIRSCAREPGTTLRPRARGRRTSCYDLASDLAGSVRGLPRDLAHNPKYMERFGE